MKIKFERVTNGILSIEEIDEALKLWVKHRKACIDSAKEHGGIKLSTSYEWLCFCQLIYNEIGALPSGT